MTRNKSKKVAGTPKTPDPISGVWGGLRSSKDNPKLKYVGTQTAHRPDTKPYSQRARFQRIGLR